MRAMLPLEVKFMMGFISGGCGGLSFIPPSDSDGFSSLGFVSLTFFLSDKKIKEQESAV